NGVLLDVLGLIGDSMQVDISGLQSGSYLLRVRATGISVLSNVRGNFSFDSTHTNQFVDKATTVSGNVVSGAGADDLGPDDAAVVHVMSQGSLVSAGGGTVITGNYGTLTIEPQDNY